MTIRVLIVDDQALVRAGFRVLLEIAPDIEIVGEADNGEDAVVAAEAERESKSETLILLGGVEESWDVP